ncbi:MULTISPECIES: antitoxin VbhA family protein [unclassified Microbacterium]|uniref:antitoxin VbhA family protein n=1 Tax=unclassified Microbacterium TaxID=2609290 RepID=UPI002468424D|nr:MULTISPECIES: antitoxin VbhA family protein [unclassified Microbacterium]MDH5134583.1 antitoxin VbhA family protein [Microbacterium sp. RD10]MDH5138137.1 antitoxin VbhA family protein [Microbacterium sp. RD11]MDH5146251.1 antitoxin VbhA family protein [Microbacterium sp. RD12]MDH5156481.1 antitoxin VbhA family protein [Microbacterium sp. RD06]MDH5167870.1 antitoxin VbhA family protein [Microbacterium sp. RD02]
MSNDGPIRSREERLNGVLEAFHSCRLDGPESTRAAVRDGWDYIEGRRSLDEIIESDVLEAGDDLRLLAVRTSDGVILYPAFQLHQGNVVRGLPDVLLVLRSGTAGDWTWAQFLNVEIPGEPTNVQKIQEGHLDEVLRDARQTAAAWRS